MSEQPQVQVDALKSFAQSRLWEIQEQYYLNSGISAWTTIPFYPTNNTFIAAHYADMILTFLHDYRDTLKPDAPVYLIEIAAGTGNFSFYLLQELLRKQKLRPALQGLKWCLVVTDIVQANLDFWRQHERFQPYIESNQVDFALFFPDREAEVKLQVQGTVLNASQIANPLIVLANYFVDSIAQDLFRIEQGKLEQMHIALSRQGEGEGLPSFAELGVEQSFHPTQLPVYEDKAINQVLEAYLQRYEKASVILPIGGFKTLRNMQALSNNRMFFIFADKGFNDAQVQDNRESFQAAVHGGALSFSVNFDSLVRFWEASGGQAYLTADYGSAIHILAGVGMADCAPSDSDLAYLFSEAISRQNPINTVYYLQQMMDEANRNNLMANIRACLGLIQLGCCDPVIIGTCADMLYQQTGAMDPGQRHDLLQMLAEAEASFYFVPTGQNLSYWFAKLYLGLGDFEKSLRWFAHSLEHHGEDPVVRYLMAMAYEGAEQFEKAIACYQQAITLMPELLEAQDAIDRLQNKPA